jgi:DNA-directed RNA polymerase specialized sigma24 family protein
MSPSPPAREPALGRWNADWEALLARVDGPAVVATWSRRHDCLAGLASLEEVVTGCRADGDVDVVLADRRLAAVVAEALAGDEIAHRLVVQRVTPPLVRRAARRAARHRMPFAEVVNDLLAAAWLIVGSYPLARRPTKVAVNILMDTERSVFGREPATLRNTVPLPPDELARHTDRASGTYGAPPEHVLDELSHVLREAVRAGLATDDAKLLAELFLLGIPASEIAARDGVSPRWIRQRRSRAVRRIAGFLGVVVNTDAEQ